MKKGEFLKKTFGYTTQSWNRILQGKKRMSYDRAQLARTLFTPYGYDDIEIWLNNDRKSEREAAWKALAEDKGIRIREAA